MSTENVKVIVRFRPTNRKEQKENIVDIDTQRNGVSISSDSERHVYQQFFFDKVLDTTSDQISVFNEVGKDGVDWLCEGYNFSIFCYGPTSTGKSYTMFGEQKSPGLVPRACERLFSLINQKEEVVEAGLKCSFLEIYRERIRDLLDTNSDPPDLKIRQSEIKGNYVQGLIEKYVYSPQEIMTVIKEGMVQRTTASTNLNNTSSRSHAVLTITLTQKLQDGSELTSKMHLVDLAGSENVGRSEVTGTTLAETQAINKSLSCLGNVIFALTEKGREHIPYRDSKLTFLLQDSLGGNSKTCIVCTATPSITCYSETVNTLKFAKRAKEIRNIPKLNRSDSPINLQRTIEQLQKRVSELELELSLKKTEPVNSNLDEAQIAEKIEKEITLFRMKNERLEKANIVLISELEKEAVKYTNLQKLYERQRELVQTVADELCDMKVKCHELSSKIDEYKMITTTLLEAEKIPDILPLLLGRVRKISNA